MRAHIVQIHGINIRRRDLPSALADWITTPNSLDETILSKCPQDSAQARARIQQAYAAYLNVKQEADKTVKQAYEVYQKAKQNAEAAVSQTHAALLRADKAVQQTYTDWKAYADWDAYSGFKHNPKKFTYDTEYAYDAYRYKLIKAAREANQRAHDSYQKACAAYEKARQNAEANMTVQQAHSAYLSAKQEADKAVRQAYEVYLNVKQEADKVVQQVVWSPARQITYRQVFGGWRGYCYDFMPLVADRKMVEDICSPVMARWAEHRYTSIALSYDYFSSSFSFQPVPFSIYCCQQDLRYQWITVSIALSYDYFSFSFSFNLVPFSIHCGQQDLRCQRRAIRSLTMQKTLDKQKFIHGTSIRNRRLLLRRIFRTSDVGQHGANTAGWLDRQKRSASNSNTGFSLIPWIGRNHRRKWRNLSWICQT